GRGAQGRPLPPTPSPKRRGGAEMFGPPSPSRGGGRGEGSPFSPSPSRGGGWGEGSSDRLGNPVVDRGVSVRGRRGSDQVDRSRFFLSDRRPAPVVAWSTAPAAETRTLARCRPRRGTLFRVGGGGRPARRLGRPARHGRRRGDHQAESVRTPRALSLAGSAAVSAANARRLPSLVGGGPAHAPAELRRPVQR